MVVVGAHGFFLMISKEVLSEIRGKLFAIYEIPRPILYLLAQNVLCIVLSIGCLSTTFRTSLNAVLHLN